LLDLQANDAQKERRLYAAT